MVLAQRLRGLADLALAAEEHQDVAGLLAPQLIGGRKDCGLFGGGGLVVFLVELHRPIAQLDRIAAARDIDDGRITEVPGEALGVDGGGGDDDLQVRPPRHQPFQVAEQEVDVQRTLVRFVHDDGVVVIEEAIALRLGEQDAVGHQLDEAFGAAVILEAQFVANKLAQWRLQFFGDACRDGARRDAPRLRVADDAGDAAAGFEADLRQLRGFTGTGFAADDDHRMLFDGAADLIAVRRDRQFFRIDDLRYAGSARLACGDGRRDLRGQRSFSGGDVLAALSVAEQAIERAKQTN